MKRNVFALTLLGATMLASAVLAVDQNIQVSARMRIGLAFSSVVDMDFTPAAGHIDFYGTPTTNTDYVTMGTNGTLTASTAVFQPSAGTGTPGSLSIDGDDVSAVFISCTPTATLAVSGTGLTMTADQLEIAMNTGVAFQNGAAYACAGLGTTPKSYTLTGTDVAILGGRLNGDPSVTTNLYSTSQTGGTPATIRVIYQ